VEGLIFLVSMICLIQEVVINVLLLIIFIEILFSHPIICCKCLCYFPWVNLLYMLMDYASLYANISYIFHILVYLGC
jgi:hypothetical protein